MIDTERQTAILTTVRKHMEKHPLYRMRHQLFAVPCGGGSEDWAIGYHSTIMGWATEGGDPMDTLHLDLQLSGDKLYLLSIGLEPENRGKGLGAQLYDIVMAIAKDLGCKEVEQTPSGCTVRGETRANYLVRRGWTLREEPGRVIVATKQIGETKHEQAQAPE